MLPNPNQALIIVTMTMEVSNHTEVDILTQTMFP